MDSISSDLKEEEPWEVHQLPSTKAKKEPCLLAHLTKENFSFAIGQQDQLIKPEVKTIPLYLSGTRKDVSDQLLPLTYSLQMKTSSLLSMTSISVSGRTTSM